MRRLVSFVFGVKMRLMTDNEWHASIDPMEM
jgi:hypothetical protein